MRVFFTVLLILLYHSNLDLNAQQCLTSLIRNENIATNSAIKDQIDRNEIKIQDWIKNNSSSPRDVITLPVVVHILWYNEEENISDEQVFSQLQVLNDDFRKKNENFSATPSEFMDRAADIEVEFCLATIDPNGNPSNGIIRTETFREGIGATEFWYNPDEGGSQAWDTDSYINIWVCNFGSEEFLGFATAPGTAEPAESDGLVINYLNFGTSGTASNSFPNHLGRTTTHEMGHYFNLEHLWGPELGGCNEDDNVADTPSQDWESEECPVFPSYDDCTFSGIGLNYSNFLDYTDDECMTMFTEGQKDRMLGALNELRPSLLLSNACSPPSYTNEDLIQELELIFANPVSSQLVISLLENDDLIEEFELWDNKGSYMLSGKVNDVLDISTLQDGVYIIRIKEFPSLTRKLLVVND